MQYEAHFYSTLPDTWANKLRVTVGQLPESAIIADRAFNAKWAARSIQTLLLGISSSFQPVLYKACLKERLRGS